MENFVVFDFPPSANMYILMDSDKNGCTIIGMLPVLVSMGSL